MYQLNDEEIHLKFLLNLSVHIDGIGDFHAPLIKEIVNTTELKYNHSLSALLLDKKNISQENIEQYTNYQVVSSAIYHDSSFRELFFCGLNLHLNKEPIMHEQGFLYFDELSEDSILTEEKFGYMRKLVTIANNISIDEEDEYDPGNELARKFIEKQKKKKANLTKYQKQTVNLRSIISGVGWKAQSFELISKLNIYQLYDGYGRLGVIDNYHYTMSGLYAGTVDSKSIKLPEINWANIIQLKK